MASPGISSRSSTKAQAPKSYPTSDTSSCSSTSPVMVFLDVSEAHSRAGSPISPTGTLGSETHPEAAAAQIWPRHEKWGKKAFLRLLVEGTLYEIPENTIEDSKRFQRNEHPFIRDVEYPIEVQDAMMWEMDALLMVLDARVVGTTRESLDIDQWSAVLHLATIWEFPALREHAIEVFDNRFHNQDALDRIELARRCDVAKWFQPAYRQLCERPESLSLDEAWRLGISQFVAISRIRDELSQLRIATLVENVEKRLEGEVVSTKAWYPNNVCKSRSLVTVTVSPYRGSKLCQEEATKLVVDPTKVVEIVAQAEELQHPV
ncbi:hypothetical protein FRB95_013998 [Tulasnella sp. JGI-2019a]|nr:hypothetical protein FRB95_013998 [Tulasnella sp. JGI-2019a]